MSELVKRLRGWWGDICEDDCREAANHITALEAENKALEAENRVLRAAFRVNMLRAFPDITHADIDDLIARALLAKEKNV